MRKIRIITYHHPANFGAALQAYGLQQAIAKMGYEVSFIDYRPDHLTKGGGLIWPRDRWSRRANLINVYLRVMHLRKQLMGDGGKTKKFEEFHRTHLRIEGTTYDNLQDLKARPPEGDVYVCGSDQIWNASEQFGIDPAYFLDFGSAEVKRISYAASFGRPYVLPRFQEETARLIKPLDAISVREKSAVPLVQGLCGRLAEWSPDPTLLVDDGYPLAIEPDSDKDYIFSYTLRSREFVQQIEEKVASQTGFSVISPETLHERKERIGPLEWLGYLKNARFVITNSYHGTLFSIIFRKPFFFVGLQGKKNSFNERSLSLLERLNCTDRFVSSDNEVDLSALAAQEIDYERIHAAVAIWRSDAQKYLKDAIEG
ncbi:polysaccharide pyruvyl transferase family protein [Cerasicoccus arenae]|uniref:Polysaccharide pyruvyl transferase domain-containing protein n=2 Tax=Cerasicoccus arenae TaxID=424488 RepID=A0A8J3DD09_9BACT|nr:polysaccharide pyruvyl transferase family protein [Cerasicoccus arenae]MBK1858648.1 polysaccharide pyruvyl transferase family protein [Cerasicoccus arenae]GHC04807.1 hypothetical protein GCM10007047_22060 [Cerasicoccus arenae]